MTRALNSNPNPCQLWKITRATIGVIYEPQDFAVLSTGTARLLTLLFLLQFIHAIGKWRGGGGGEFKTTPPPPLHSCLLLLRRDISLLPPPVPARPAASPYWSRRQGGGRGVRTVCASAWKEPQVSAPWALTTPALPEARSAGQGLALCRDVCSTSWKGDWSMQQQSKQTGWLSCSCSQASTCRAE